MGATLSRESGKAVLQQKVLNYLKSNCEDDYKINPSKTFKIVHKYGYSNLEDFVQDLKKDMVEPFVPNDIHPTAKPGIRYVVKDKDNRAKRGVLVKLRTSTDNKRIAFLKMDGKRNPNYLLCLGKRKKLLSILLDELEPEKVYFQSFLMTPFSDFQPTVPTKKASCMSTEVNPLTSTIELPKLESKTNSTENSTEKNTGESGLPQKGQNSKTSLHKMNIRVEMKHSTLTKKHADPVISANLEPDLPEISLHEGNEDLNETCLIQQSVTKTDISTGDFPILEISSTVIDAANDSIATCLQNSNEHQEEYTHSQIDDLCDKGEINVGPSNLETDSQVNETKSPFFYQHPLPKESDQPFSVNENISTEPSKQTKGKRKRKSRKRSLSTDQNTKDSQSKRKHSDLTTQLEGQELNVSNPFVGTQKGISGYSNSCYMDSLLVSIFYCTAMFNGILLPKSEDSSYASQCRKYLRENIVMPLRKKYYCSAENAMKLRTHLSKLDDDILGSFMDVEQLLYLLFDDALKEREFIQYSDGVGDFMHQTSIDNTDKSTSITVQTNLKTSMRLNGNLKFQSVPNPALIVGLPRSNGKFVQYSTVIPSVELDISNIIEPAVCSLCQQTADWEKVDRKNIESPEPCCDVCSERHASANLDNTRVIVSRKRMRLIAVICVRASHFTAFIRNTMGSDEWLFFDSMAGGGPEVKVVNNLDKWLEIIIIKLLENPNRAYQRDNDWDSFLKMRSCCDGHMCIYEQICYPGLYPLN